MIFVLASGGGWDELLTNNNHLVLTISLDGVTNGGIEFEPGVPARIGARTTVSCWYQSDYLSRGV